MMPYRNGTGPDGKSGCLPNNLPYGFYRNTRAGRPRGRGSSSEDIPYTARMPPGRGGRGRGGRGRGAGRGRGRGFSRRAVQQESSTQLYEFQEPTDEQAYKEKLDELEHKIDDILNKIAKLED